jgi:hypothetical protein
MKNNELDMFEKLAIEARSESILPVSVAQQVLDTLHARQNYSIPTQRVDLFFGVGSFVAACAALIVFYLGAGEDTLFAFVQLFVTVLP